MLNRALAVLILVGAGVAGSAIPAAIGAQTTALNTVQALDYAVLLGGNILIRLTFREPLARAPTVLASYHPAATITFDFEATTSAAGREALEINQRGLRSLQLVEARGRTRLIILLTRPHVYETGSTGRELLITLRRPESLSRSEDRGAAPEPRHSLRSVSFEPGAAGVGRIIVELSDSAIAVDVHQQGKALIVDFFDSALPPHLARRLDVRDFGTAVQAIETRRVGNAVRMRIELEGAGEYSAYQLSRQFIVAPRAGGQ